MDNIHMERINRRMTELMEFDPARHPFHQQIQHKYELAVLGAIKRALEKPIHDGDRHLSQSTKAWYMAKAIQSILRLFI